MNNTPRPSNPVWEYFEKIGDTKRALCRLCGEEYSFYSSSGNLKLHLKKKHIHAYLKMEGLESQNECDEEGGQKVLYEFVVAGSPTASAEEAPTTPCDKEIDTVQSNIPVKRRRLSEHAVGKSKSNRLIEELTEEKIVVTKLQKELIEKEMVEKNLKITLLQEELEHKKEMYEIEKQEMQYRLEEMEHKKQMNELTRQELLLKIEVLKAKLKRNMRDSESPQ